MNIFTIINDNVIFLLLVVLIIMFIFNRSGIAALFNRLKSQQNSITNDNMPLIMAYYTQGHTLNQLATGKVNGMRYAALVTASTPGQQGAEQNTSAGALIYTLNLPFNTQAHIVGVSKKYALDSALLKTYLKIGNLLEITLEGDYPNTFSLFAEPGQDAQVRYVLDPKAMQFTIDYCVNNFWEIAGDEMYIVATQSQKETMNLLKDSVKFVEEIRPRFNKPQPGDDPVKHDAPYGEYDGEPLNCPICQSAMVLHSNWQACPAQHGILINGRYVIQIRKQQMTAPAETGKPVEHGKILCPSCQSQMQQVDYQNSGTIIDSCPNCPFRWLDATEAEKIITKV